MKQIVIITTASKLTPAQKTAVMKVVTKKVGSDFTLQEKVDSKVIGGIKFAIGNKEFDVTVEGKLKELSTQVMSAQIVTAVALTTTQKNKIKQAIEEKYGNMPIETIIDPAVIGGIKIRIGSNEFDGTLLAKIEKLRTQLRGSI